MIQSMFSLTLKKNEHKTIDDLLKETVQSPFGMEVPISEFVEVKEGTSSDTVSRKNGKAFRKCFRYNNRQKTLPKYQLIFKKTLMNLQFQQMLK